MGQVPKYAITIWRVTKSLCIYFSQPDSIRHQLLVLCWWKTPRKPQVIHVSLVLVAKFCLLICGDYAWISNYTNRCKGPQWDYIDYGKLYISPYLHIETVLFYTSLSILRCTVRTRQSSNRSTRLIGRRDRSPREITLSQSQLPSHDQACLLSPPNHEAVHRHQALWMCKRPVMCVDLSGPHSNRPIKWHLELAGSFRIKMPSLVIMKV